MTIELGGFIGLAALMITLFTWLRGDVAGLRADVSADIGELRTAVASLSERMAHVEDLLAPRPEPPARTSDGSSS